MSFLFSAGENLLALDVFTAFPHLRELELPLNGIRELNISSSSSSYSPSPSSSSPLASSPPFPHLHTLDLSYNSLEATQLSRLGSLPVLKTLKLSGNGLTYLPAEMTRPISLSGEDEIVTKTKEQVSGIKRIRIVTASDRTRHTSK